MSDSKNNKNLEKKEINETNRRSYSQSSKHNSFIIMKESDNKASIKLITQDLSQSDFEKSILSSNYLRKDFQSDLSSPSNVNIYDNTHTANSNQVIDANSKEYTTNNIYSDNDYHFELTNIRKKDNFSSYNSKLSANNKKYTKRTRLSSNILKADIKNDSTPKIANKPEKENIIEHNETKSFNNEDTRKEINSVSLPKGLVDKTSLYNDEINKLNINPNKKNKYSKKMKDKKDNKLKIEMPMFYPSYDNSSVSPSVRYNNSSKKNRNANYNNKSYKSVTADKFIVNKTIKRILENNFSKGSNTDNIENIKVLNDHIIDFQVRKSIINSNNPLNLHAKSSLPDRFLMSRFNNNNISNNYKTNDNYNIKDIKNIFNGYKHNEINELISNNKKTRFSDTTNFLTNSLNCDSKDKADKKKLKAPYTSYNIKNNSNLNTNNNFYFNNDKKTDRLGKKGEFDEEMSLTLQNFYNPNMLEYINNNEQKIPEIDEKIFSDIEDLRVEKKISTLKKIKQKLNKKNNIKFNVSKDHESGKKGEMRVESNYQTNKNLVISPVGNFIKNSKLNQSNINFSKNPLNSNYKQSEVSEEMESNKNIENNTNNIRRLKSVLKNKISNKNLTNDFFASNMNRTIKEEASGFYDSNMNYNTSTFKKETFSNNTNNLNNLNSIINKDDNKRDFQSKLTNQNLENLNINDINNINVNNVNNGENSFFKDVFKNSKAKNERNSNKSQTSSFSHSSSSSKNSTNKDHEEELKEFFKHLNNENMLKTKTPKAMGKDGNYITARKSGFIKNNRRRGLMIEDEKEPAHSESEQIKNLNEKEKKTIFKYDLFKDMIIWSDIIMSFLIFCNIVISIIDMEVYYDKTDEYLSEIMTNHSIIYYNEELLSYVSKREISSKEKKIKVINLIISLVLVGFVFLHYFLNMKLLKQDREISEYDNIFTSGEYKMLIVEIFIIVIFVPPNLNKSFYGTSVGMIFTYDLVSIINMLILIKVYVIIRTYTYFSVWTSSTSYAVCNKYKINKGIVFAVKAELKSRPFQMISIMMVVSVLICALALRTCEYGLKPLYSKSSLKGDNNLQSFTNCLWVVIVSMSTVGYGDMTPKSSLGRLIGVFACVIGMLLVSLIVVALSVIVEFTEEEKKAYCIVKKKQADDIAYEQAANVIKTIFEYYHWKNKIENNIGGKSNIDKWNNQSNLLSRKRSSGKIFRSRKLIKSNNNIYNLNENNDKNTINLNSKANNVVENKNFKTIEYQKSNSFNSLAHVLSNIHHINPNNLVKRNSNNSNKNKNNNLNNNLNSNSINNNIYDKAKKLEYLDADSQTLMIHQKSLFEEIPNKNDNFPIISKNKKYISNTESLYNKIINEKVDISNHINDSVLKEIHKEFVEDKCNLNDQDKLDIFNHLSLKFIFLSKIKNRVKNFKYEFKIAQNYNLPVDEMVGRLGDQLKKSLNSLYTKISIIENFEHKLKFLSQNQYSINTLINESFTDQNKITKYLTYLNNENYFYYCNYLKEYL